MNKMLQTNSARKKLNSDQLSLVKNIVEAAEDVKGFDIALLDVSKVFDLADHFVIISGRSDRHVQGIVNNIKGSLEAIKIKPLALEGYDKAHWVLLDYGNVIVHVFYESAREVYDLESLWCEATPLPVKKLDSRRKKLEAA